MLANEVFGIVTLAIGCSFCVIESESFSVRDLDSKKDINYLLSGFYSLEDEQIFSFTKYIPSEGKWVDLWLWESQGSIHSSILFFCCLMMLPAPMQTLPMYFFQLKTKFMIEEWQVSYLTAQRASFSKIHNRKWISKYLFSDMISLFIYVLIQHMWAWCGPQQVLGGEKSLRKPTRAKTHPHQLDFRKSGQHAIQDWR